MDRPAHVRAGSSLAWFGGRLAVVQDDASFVALIDPAVGRVDALALPLGKDRVRQFDDARGNKQDKPDWEACAVTPSAAGETLWLFGSGSTGRRESVALIHSSGEVELFAASGLYGQLRAQVAFSGSELNVEGALFCDRRIRLFNRGNGARRDGLAPVNASCDIDAATLEAHLRSPGSVPPPQLERIVAYDLGTIQGARLTFTDAAVAEKGIFYLATAEDSADAVSDGVVGGSAIGIMDSHGCRWIELRESDGTVSRSKTEGIALVLAREGALFAVVDADDPERPSELCEIVLNGTW
ncbi:MAG: hypothetical protein FIA97_17390 [Methylococcaceae bacterium]|nr:hypothetical protein [Methylococcaceae bacterium]